jgi:hypothetical protein
MIFSNKLNFVLAFIFVAVWASALADTVPHTKFRGTLVVTDLTKNYGQTGVIEFINNVTTYGEYVGNATRLVYALFPSDYLGQSTIHIAGCHGDDRTDESQTISHGMISRISLFDCNFRAIGNNGGDPVDYSSNLTVNLINVMGEQYCLPPNVLDNGRCVTPCICSELKDEETGNCYPMEKLSNWQDDIEFGVTYPYPENNHGVPRCKVSSLEVEPIDSLMCPASANSTQTQNPIDCATGQKKYVELDYQGYGLDALSLKRA